MPSCSCEVQTDMNRLLFHLLNPQRYHLEPFEIASSDLDRTVYNPVILPTICESSVVLGRYFKTWHQNESHAFDLAPMHWRCPFWAAVFGIRLFPRVPFSTKHSHCQELLHHPTRYLTQLPDSVCEKSFYVRAISMLILTVLNVKGF